MYIPITIEDGWNSTCHMLKLSCAISGIIHITAPKVRIGWNTLYLYDVLVWSTSQHMIYFYYQISNEELINNFSGKFFQVAWEVMNAFSCKRMKKWIHSKGTFQGATMNNTSNCHSGITMAKKRSGWLLVCKLFQCQGVHVLHQKSARTENCWT